MKKHRALIALLAIVFGLAAAPAYAEGDDDDSSAVASLTGENLLASEFPQLIGSLVVEGTCELMGQSTFTFTATGLATGPYPGTFTETGTVVLDEFPDFTAASFESTFEIVSPVGTVTGEKSLAGFASTSIGLCGTAAFPGGGPSAMRFEGTLSYRADIVTPTGTAVDRGTTFVNMGDTQLRGVPGGGFVFSENYTSTSLEPGPGTCDDDDDDDDDGDDDDEGEDDRGDDCGDD